MINLPDKSFKIIRTTRGNNLLMINGFTYSQHVKHSSLFYCSQRKGAKCKASVKLNEHGELGQILGDHGHDPPRYVLTPRGEYCKI